MRKRTVILLLIFIIVFAPEKVFAMDLQYVENPSAWLENNEVITVSTEFENYYGQYRYYIDKFDKCVYFYIAYSENSLTRHDNDVEIGVEISNKEHKYSFNFDQNGFVFGSESVKKIIDLKSSFSAASEYGQDIYFGIEFLDKYDKTQNNTVSISITVNGNDYYICKGITAEFEEETVTEKIKENSGKAEKTTIKKQKSSTIQNQKNTITSKVKGTDSKSTERTTKYKYTSKPNASNNSEYAYSAELETSSPATLQPDEAGSDEAFIISEQDDKSKLSSTAKILISAAVLLIIIGTALVINYFAKPKVKTGDENE